MFRWMTLLVCFTRMLWLGFWVVSSQVYLQNPLCVGYCCLLRTQGEHSMEEKVACSSWSNWWQRCLWYHGTWCRRPSFSFSYSCSYRWGCQTSSWRSATTPSTARKRMPCGVTEKDLTQPDMACTLPTLLSHLMSLVQEGSL